MARMTRVSELTGSPPITPAVSFREAVGRLPATRPIDDLGPNALGGRHVKGKGGTDLRQAGGTALCRVCADIEEGCIHEIHALSE